MMEKEDRECVFMGLQKCTHPYEKCSECPVVDAIEEMEMEADE